MSSAQEPSNASENTCTGSSVISVPSRPTVTSATDTTQCGVVELEYGLERQWPGGGANRDDLSGGLRLGLTHNLDLHWSSSDFLHLMDGAGNRTGFGDYLAGSEVPFPSADKTAAQLGFVLCGQNTLGERGARVRLGPG